MRTRAFTLLGSDVLHATGVHLLPGETRLVELDSHAAHVALPSEFRLVARLFVLDDTATLLEHDCVSCAKDSGH